MNLERWRCFCGIALALALFVAWSSLASAQTPTASPEPTSAPLTGLLQWQTDGVPVVTANGLQLEPQIVTDGAGGGIVVWQDYRPYYNYTAPRYLYAQHVSASGQPLWQPDGIPVALLGNRDPQVVSDGQAGAIVAWYDVRDDQSRVFVQRIAPDGRFLWAANGLELSVSEELGTPRLASDQAGGAFVTWADYGERQGVWPSARVQHVLPDGSFAWDAGGVAVTILEKGQFAPQIVADGAGGAIVTWRGDCSLGWQGLCTQLGQRIHSDGARAWSDQGVTLSVSTTLHPETQMLADGMGGATIVWLDQRNLKIDIYAQRVSPDGATQWVNGGMPVVVAEGDQALPRVISDGADGIIIAWHDTRDIDPNVLLQRLGSDGHALWDPAGIPVGFQRMQATYDGERHYDLAPDGTGGALVVWQDQLEAEPQLMNAIRLQRISADGAPQWSGQGAMVQLDRYFMGLSTPRLLPLDTADVIVVWADNRRGYKSDNYDIYAQRVVEGTHKRYLPFIWR